MPLVIRNYVLVDLDHVVFDAFWRDPMIGTASWDEYHAAGREDTPVYDIVHLLKALSDSGHTIIGFTARPAKWRKQSMEMCLKFDVPLDDLLMRPDDNYRPAPEVKMELALAFFRSEQLLKESVALVLDDREDVCAAFKGLGITTLQVHARKNPR
jgi:hypothetical protein